MVQAIRVRWSYTTYNNTSTTGEAQNLSSGGLIADVFHLVFTPIPQLLRGVDVKSFRVWKYGQ